MTNRTVFDFDANGRIAGTHRDDRGVLFFDRSELPEEIDRLRARYGNKPILAAGSIGSDKGWLTAPYVAAPASLADIARAVVETGIPGVTFTPGLSYCDDEGMPDVMRGEELQFLGAAAADLVPPGALLCQPGTHCKWAKVEGHRITWFRTAMTGELFGLIARHSIVIGPDAEPVDPARPEFALGVLSSPRDSLPTLLFRARAARVTGKWSASQCSAYASGVLIGIDVASNLERSNGTVHVLADDRLGPCYSRAIGLLGARAVTIDSRTAFARGAQQVWRSIAGELA
ncbi:2-dehydro-3-deoxygalactonokinase [Sphingomonas sp.]|uniref:2-dehydro-3-deoxygalactonokinase n=1 Tax=Sphingomonas sp. TaxID=28214 RepID=UPI001EBF2DFF|nr:2-dehydro-3-deoxygalactonokinase [Sphingomonas sp.]MBX3595835.1 2-dehydro-3-deoxygalactonokinase [Sphingomonas sp.]